MSYFSSVSRRSFLAKSIVGASAVALASSPRDISAGAVKPDGDPFRGLKVGVASYTLREFTLDQAMEMTRKAGVKYITLKDVHLPMKSSREERQAVASKLEAAGFELMGGASFT
jgi:hypothetical protein